MSDTSLKKLFNRNFLEYASYVIKDRAIPDDADGLKPVQRRILWSLFEMDDGRFSKVANVIGHCMKYHPHGDQSIGDALVSLANRGYFIERQGNFGNIFTGDRASAPRYIECRLTDLARETLFNKRITDFSPSYDGRNSEPLLLPVKLPVVLLLGAEGIAVGLSTRILPHNFQEVLKAQVACLRDQEFELFPDFPQGGRIDVTDYDDGRGRIRNRARIEKQGQKNLIIRELPWGTTTESIISSIELAANKGKIKVASIDDYTTDSVEINVRLSRGVDADEGLKLLFAHTDCEKPHTSNIIVIQDGYPVETNVTELVHYSTGRLIEILKLELKLELDDFRNRLHWLDLEQIFIENRLYKSIEECTSWEN
ncbi:MAG: DNA topoisomerase IV subunit A, partial [Candidatus Aegiribacteria sp.]|nr:DNA topoisomerase IV subunit A [Candidatus Aegiribacteria sp.]